MHRIFFLPTSGCLQNGLPICPGILDPELREVFLLVLYALFYIIFSPPNKRLNEGYLFLKNKDSIPV
jgi:hypothetical protein